jgi:hypothetical protein
VYEGGREWGEGAGRKEKGGERRDHGKGVMRVWLFLISVSSIIHPRHASVASDTHLRHASVAPGLVTSL